uniref:Putative low affinity cationic amino acid transporter 2-like protein n=1 Tax=Ixodes ricinus TaxID=34613 RepID=A0A0K8RFG4_IXORI
MGRIAGLDGLRALGVVLVLVVANVALQAVTCERRQRSTTSDSSRSLVGALFVHFRERCTAVRALQQTPE